MRVIWILSWAALAAACGRPPLPERAIRLVDVFDEKRVQRSAARSVAPLPRAEWKFDGPAAPGPRALAATRGFEAGPGVAGLAVRDGLLVGRTTSTFSLLHVERTTGLEDNDDVQSFEIRMRVSRGANLAVATGPPEARVHLARVARRSRRPWKMTTPVVADEHMRTYRITLPSRLVGSRIRHLLVRPTDAPGAEFAIESVRLVFRREQMAEAPSGVSWQGLQGVYRETLVTRTPESVRFDLRLPRRPTLDLSLGTPGDEPVTFRVRLESGGGVRPLLEHTVTAPGRWEGRVVDLNGFGGATVSLHLSASSPASGAVAFWGAPAVRPRALGPPGSPPQGVILIQADTLRRDHLDIYGYHRPTAPVLRRLAEEGALFEHAISQASWTKPATPSVLTSLYPSTHGVVRMADRLPSSATTIAEVFREAGYATLSFSSVGFTGQPSNLHQGFEVLHEAEPAGGGTKTARDFVDRLSDWLERHDDVPFFAFLHFFDPHGPYEPKAPYDTMWADTRDGEEYRRQQDVLRRLAGNAFARRGMGSRDDLLAAGLDPGTYIRHSKDWYDGSIRAMDTEIGRLLERLQERGLGSRSVVAFFSDHGEEFHDHGRMAHGHSLYGEMIRVPLIVWGPGRVTGGRRVEETVQLIDVMPTLLDAAGLAPPERIQGRSLLPLLVPARSGTVVAADGWTPGPAIAEKHPQAAGDPGDSAEAYAIVDGGWKLIHNAHRVESKPEFELFDFVRDPLDQNDQAARHPELVNRLAAGLAEWRRRAVAARLKPVSEEANTLSREELERLRSLGYLN